MEMVSEGQVRPVLICMVPFSSDVLKLSWVWRQYWQERARLINSAATIFQYVRMEVGRNQSVMLCRNELSQQIEKCVRKEIKSHALVHELSSEDMQ